MKNHPFFFAVSGVKNSGKTSLIEKLVPELVRRGLKVAVIKHDGHDFTADVPGTDSFRYKAAGAYGSAVFSDAKYQIVKEQTNSSPEDLAAAFPEADLILLEGFKHSSVPKVELVRRGNSTGYVCDPETVRAVISDFCPEHREEIPVLNFDEIGRLADLILEERQERRKKMKELQLEDALQLLLDRTVSMEETENVAAAAAAGRILGEDLRAQRDQPPFPRSPLDGYAVRSEDLAGACQERPARLRVVDEIMAGCSPAQTVVKGTAVRLMTGAPIPQGADTVVRQEDTDYGEQTVEIYVNQNAWDNYCFAGEDYQAGSVVLRRGTSLGAAEIGMISSLGLEEVPVFRKPRVMVLATGDEVILPGRPLKPGQIYDSNLHMLRAQLQLWGMDVIQSELCADDAKEAAERIRAQAQNADLIVTTGGVSVGKKDIMHEVFALLGCEQIFWKVAVKPGMPTLAGQYGGTLLICLSGNPYGAIANLQLLVRPVLAKMTGRKDLELKYTKAVLENAYRKKSRTRRYVRAYCEDGRVRVARGSNDSGIISNLCGCNCMIAIPAGTEALQEGDTVPVVLL